MAVSEIKQYRQKDGTDILKVFTKPTKKFPDGGYFYVDAKDIDVIQSCSWSLMTDKKNTYVITGVNLGYNRQLLYLHQKLAYKYLGYYPDYIDHRNGIGIDNVDENLNVVTQRQNIYNSFSRGYSKDSTNRLFQVRIKTPVRLLYPYNSVHSEVDACQLAYLAETDYLKLILGSDYYMYDFFKDRRNDLDILDLERTGVVSAEEATYKHVIRYAKDNAWYYYRYNLEQYFKDNHISAPNFITDEGGFMRHPATNKLLCPFYYRR